MGILDHFPDAIQRRVIHYPASRILKLTTNVVSDCGGTPAEANDRKRKKRERDENEEAGKKKLKEDRFTENGDVGGVGGAGCDDEGERKKKGSN